MPNMEKPKEIDLGKEIELEKELNNVIFEPESSYSRANDSEPNIK